MSQIGDNFQAWLDAQQATLTGTTEKATQEVYLINFLLVAAVIILFLIYTRVR